MILVDPIKRTINFESASDIQILYTLFMRAKFAKPDDLTVLANPHLVSLTNGLKQLFLESLTHADSYRAASESGFGSIFLNAVLVALCEETHGIDWLRLSKAERISFLQQIIAAPRQFTDEEIEFLLDGTDAYIDRCAHVSENATKS